MSETTARPPGQTEPAAGPEPGPSAGLLRRLFPRRALFARLSLGAAALAVLGGLIHLTVSADGFIRRADLEREKIKLEAEIDGLRHENRLLRQKIDHLLNDPGYVEDEARKKLGLIRPGETVYRLSEEPDLTEEEPAPPAALP